MSKIGIDIKEIYNEDDLFSKVAEMKIGSSETFNVLPAAGSKIRPNTIEKIKDKLIVENYITITLTELRDMDSDHKKQEKFIKNKVKVASNYPFIALKLLIKKGEKIEANDVEYMVDLLKSPLNIFVAPPLIYYYWSGKKSRVVVGEQIPIDTYLEVIDTFLKRLREGHKIDECALTVPANVARSSVKVLLDKYKDMKTQIALIDLNGKTAINIYPIINALTVGATGKVKEYTLPEKNGEDYMLYAFDGVPYNFSSKGIMPAKDILQYAMGFSSYGPRHTIKFNIEGPPPPDNPKVYEPKKYTYLNNKHTEYTAEIKKLDEWINTNFGEGEYKRSSYVKDYNFTKQVGTANEILKSVKEKELGHVLEKKLDIQEYLEIIKRYNKGASGKA